MNSRELDQLRSSSGHGLETDFHLLDDYKKIRRTPPRFLNNFSPSVMGSHGFSKIMAAERNVHKRTLETFQECRLLGEDFIIKDGEIFNRYFATGFARTKTSAENFQSGKSRKLKIHPAEEGGKYTIERLYYSSSVDLDFRVFLGTSDEPVNYGMWLFIVIPAVHEFLENRHLYDKFMCHCSRPWQRKILRGLGIPDADLIEHDLEKIYRCASLTLHRASHRDLYLRDSYFPAIRWVAEKFKNQGSASERIFVSRLSRTKNGAYRGLLNEEIFIDEIKKLDFRIVEPELLSFVEQVNLFARASTIVGLGGAGMFNTVFCKEGTKVLDIESGLKFLDSHCNMFSSCKLDYAVLLGEEDPEDPRLVQKRWKIDIKESMQVIESFVKDRMSHPT
ncbi:glycosyltransferase family 61 protein [Paracoccus liaowanqingii]|uniref:glycosyltransferase family 61 protein n=1 Tax=Paracoccus liaowanqingii TaxID=2560053 RepID=UPI001092274A|nr:glycosyltransferase family 61 protein [Paracoccus liaowanqingii]